MAEPHVLPVTAPPSLDVEDTSDERAETMVAWFYENFGDPANSLPYDSERGGYQWLFGGPYDALDQLYEAFPDADLLDIKRALERIQAVHGRIQWTVSRGRIVGFGDHYQDAEFGKRRMPPPDDRRAYTIVQTILYPSVTWQWAARATFLPGTINEELGTELDLEGEVLTADDEHLTIDGEEIVFGSLPDKREVRSVRELIGLLLEEEMSSGDESLPPELERSRDWVKSLERDSDLFVDDSIVTHSSPPVWTPLSKLFGKGLDVSSVSVIVLVADSPGKATGLLLAYGGARIFVQLIHGVNFVQAAFFERMAQRIRRGDYDMIEGRGRRRGK